MNREVDFYVGFKGDSLADERSNPVILETLQHWPDIKGYQWFKSKVNIPVPGVTKIGAVESVEMPDE